MNYSNIINTARDQLMKKFTKPRVVDQVIADPLNSSITQIPTVPAQAGTQVRQVTVDPLASNSTQIPTVTPIQIPQANNQVRQVTVDPMQQPQGNITPIVLPSTTNTVNPQQPAQTANSIFSGVDPRISQGYTNTLADTLSGKIYDPFAAGSKEAMARAEANKRASDAGQIASAGFSGTGIGQQIAGGTENQLLQNRFTTLNDIEKNRNEARTGALGEARAFGTAEEGVREYNQNFTEDQRRYNQDFSEDQKRYGDTQNWKAYEQALVNGSDTDVAAAYKAATGKDLDPMAVSQYRGYARTAIQQGLESGDIANQQARQNLTTAKNSQSGADFAAYSQTHLDIGNMTADQAMQDQGFKNAAQKMWEASGGTGDVPSAWALMQYKAANDPKLTNSIVASKYAIDQAVASGAMSAEDGQLLNDFNSSGMTQFLKRDPTTGKVTVDYDALAKLTGTSTTTTTTGTTTGQGGVTVKIPVDTTGKPTVNNGGYFYGEDNNLYTVEDGEPVSADLSDVLASKDWNKIKNLYSSNPEKVSAEVPVLTTDTARTQRGTGQVVGFPGGGIAKVTGSHKLSNYNSMPGKADVQQYALELELSNGKKAEIRNAWTGKAWQAQIWQDTGDGTLHHTGNITE